MKGMLSIVVVSPKVDIDSYLFSSESIRLSQASIFFLYVLIENKTGLPAAIILKFLKQVFHLVFILGGHIADCIDCPLMFFNDSCKSLLFRFHFLFVLPVRQQTNEKKTQKFRFT